MSLNAAFRSQARACASLGSPFMEQLLTMLSAHWPEDSALAQRCAAFEGDIGPAGHSLPLRIAGGLHALVLQGVAPYLAEVYPPNAPTEDALRQSVLQALSDQEPFLLDWIENAPQTNEVRRSAALISGARVACGHFDLPIFLSELGASGGLNLLWDRYALTVGDVTFGPEDAPVQLAPDWDGPPPEGKPPAIAARAGVDLNPLDPRDPADLLRLTAYLWPDQPQRLANTRAAAGMSGLPPDRGDALAWLGPRLEAAPEGHLHLIQHTVAWQYFPEEVQRSCRRLIEETGAKATDTRPLAWLSMEADGRPDGAALTLRLWPGEITLDLGRADFHGRWIAWKG